MVKLVEPWLTHGSQCLGALQIDLNQGRPGPWPRAPRWILLAHGEHWGAGGGGINAQMSSIFVRKRRGSMPGWVDLGWFRAGFLVVHKVVK